MPFYRFNFQSDAGVREDHLGQELVSDEAALEEAIMAARELVIQRVRWGEVIRDEAYEVSNAAGDLVHRVTLKSVLILE